MSTDASALLAEIQRLLEEGSLTRIEVERGMRDLEKIRRRLVDREYQKSSFGSNTFNVAERARDVLVEVEFYAALGRRWAALFEAIGAEKSDRILDLAPGFTPKVELGLLYAGFDKTVVAIDKDAEALDNLRQFVELFDPPFAIETVAADFLETPIAPGDVVAANHTIDDVVAEHYCRTRSLDLRAAYQEEQRFRELWASILAEQSAVLDEVVPRLAAAFTRLVRAGGALIAVQYPSYSERLLGLGAIDELCHSLLSRCVVLLEPHGFVRDRETPDGALAKSDLFGAESCYLLRRKR